MNQDTLVSLFASNIFPDVPTLFPENDSKFLNVVLINLPAKLVCCKYTCANIDGSGKGSFDIYRGSKKSAW